MSRFSHSLLFFYGSVLLVFGDLDKTKTDGSKVLCQGFISFVITFKVMNMMNRFFQTVLFVFLMGIGSYAQNKQILLPADLEIPLKYGWGRSAG